jgi:hypothetical protein
MTDPFIAYEATGTDLRGRRNPVRRGSFIHLQGLNYAYKTIWGILPNGKRKLIYIVRG